MRNDHHPNIDNNKEIAAEVIRRAEVLSAKKKSRRQRIAFGWMSAACITLIVCVSFLMPETFTDKFNNISSGSLYTGAFFAGGGSGGYLLIGILAFALGVAITLFCLRRGKK